MDTDTEGQNVLAYAKPDKGCIHPVFRVDPRMQLSLIDKFVQVTTQAGQTQGFLDCIDPVSQSVVLSVSTGDTFQHRLFPGSSLIDMVELSPPPDLQPRRESKKTAQLTPELLEVKRMKVVEWLQKNLLPVSLQGDIIDVHNGALLLYPPYDHSNCVTDNSIVLGRMQHLLKNVPNM